MGMPALRSIKGMQVMLSNEATVAEIPTVADAPTVCVSCAYALALASAKTATASIEALTVFFMISPPRGEVGYRLKILHSHLHQCLFSLVLLLRRFQVL
jgi:hypothetical protein